MLLPMACHNYINGGRPHNTSPQMTRTEAFILIRNNVRSIKDSKKREYLNDVVMNDGTQHEVWSSDLIEFAQQFA